MGSGSLKACHTAMRGKNSSVKHHGFIQMCYFELNVILYEMNCLSPSALHTKIVKKPHDFLERRRGGESTRWQIMMRSSRAWGGWRQCSRGAWPGVEGGACVGLREKAKGRGVVIWHPYLSIKQDNRLSLVCTRVWQCWLHAAYPVNLGAMRHSSPQSNY